MGRPHEAVLPADEELPTMTLMICAYNEEDIVKEKMANTLALDYPKDKFRIMWVTDGSNDHTNELLAAYPEVDTVHGIFQARVLEWGAIGKGLKVCKHGI